MGPAIILDKSAFQSLSRRELFVLDKHYLINVTPILAWEILGDLAKEPSSEAIGRVKILANKQPEAGVAYNLEHKTMLLAALNGDYGQPDYRPAVASRHVPLSDGRYGVMIEDTYFKKAFRRWTRGKFTEDEKAQSQKYRQDIQQFDLADLMKDTKAMFQDVEMAKDIPGIVAQVRDTYRNGKQYDLLNVLMGLLRLKQADHDRIVARWAQGYALQISRFAPYGLYTLVLATAFNQCLAQGLIGTRRTNIIDLQYLYYLPFCRVFVSGDNFHKEFAPAFMTGQQSFVGGVTLKEDLQRIISRWDGLSDKEKEEYAYDRGSYPPEDEASFTWQMWKKYMPPWKPGSGNRVLRMTDEENRRTMQELRPIIDALEKADRDSR